jgi:hypothetical protein
MRLLSFKIGGNVRRTSQVSVPKAIKPSVGPVTGQDYTRIRPEWSRPEPCRKISGEAEGQPHAPQNARSHSGKDAPA